MRTVILAKARIQLIVVSTSVAVNWIPAFAGMTNFFALG